MIIENIGVTLGGKLRDLRVSKGNTQKELADLFGVSVSAISMYELGLRVPSDKIKVKYSTYFNKNIENIFFNQKVH